MASSLLYLIEEVATLSRRSKKRKIYDKHHKRSWEVFQKKYDKWRRREPSRWHIFAWLKWRSERPYKSKDAIEYEKLYDKYGPYRDRYRWLRLW